MDINLKISLFEKMSLEKMIFSVKNVFWKYDIYVLSQQGSAEVAIKVGTWI
jgi:hypothetical protein